MKKDIWIAIFFALIVPLLAATGSHAETTSNSASGAAINISAKAAVLIEGNR